MSRLRMRSWSPNGEVSASRCDKVRSSSLRRFPSEVRHNFGKCILLQRRTDVVRYSDRYNPLYISRPRIADVVKPAVPFFPDELISGKLSVKLGSTCSSFRITFLTLPAERKDVVGKDSIGTVHRRSDSVLISSDFAALEVAEATGGDEQKVCLALFCSVLFWHKY